MILTFKYQIRTTTGALTRLRAHASSVNQVWNYCNSYQKFIERQNAAGAARKRWPSRFDYGPLIRGSSKELGLHAQTIGLVSITYANRRDLNKGSTRFRSSFGPNRSLGWVPFDTQSRQINGSKVKYLGWHFQILGTKTRPIPGNAKSGCFVEDARGRWYVCFYAEVEQKPTGTAVVGIDLGLKSLATLSDGTKIKASQYFRRLEQKLGCAQRANNKKRVRAIHAKIANSRKDFLHKLSAKIASENALIAVGNVSPSQLIKKKRQFAKSILDAGWSTFRNQLRYKASRHGAVYLEVDERFTTQTCSHCGGLPPERPKGIAGLGIREWECSNCGTSHDRDVNAAKNILALALGTQRPDEGSLDTGGVQINGSSSKRKNLRKTLAKLPGPVKD